MTANHDTPEAVEAMALDVERTFYSDAAGMLRRLHQRAVAAERERDEAARLRDAYRSNEATVITENDGLRWTLNNTRASLVAARADALNEAMPEEVTESMAPQCMGNLDALSWTLGWNSCRLSILALIKQPSTALATARADALREAAKTTRYVADRNLPAGDAERAILALINKEPRHD